MCYTRAVATLFEVHKLAPIAGGSMIADEPWLASRILAVSPLATAMLLATPRPFSPS